MTDLGGSIFWIYFGAYSHIAGSSHYVDLLHFMSSVSHIVDDFGRMFDAIFTVKKFCLSWIIYIKDYVPYIFATLLCKYKREHLWNKVKYFLFHLESSFHLWDNQILTFQILKCHEVIKCLGTKHETHFAE